MISHEHDQSGCLAHQEWTEYLEPYKPGEERLIDDFPTRQQDWGKSHTSLLEGSDVWVRSGSVFELFIKTEDRTSSLVRSRWCYRTGPLEDQDHGPVRSKTGPVRSGLMKMIDSCNKEYFTKAKSVPVHYHLYYLAIMYIKCTVIRNPSPQ